MAETKKEATAQEPSTAAASQETDTKPVVDLLSSILNEVQKQVRSKTPKPLEGLALQAVDQFREIVAALALQPKPTIKLTATPPSFQDPNGGETTLEWLSTFAQKVKIDSDVGPAIGEVTPAAGGNITRRVSQTTKFTATATGPCSSETASVTVTVPVVT